MEEDPIESLVPVAFWRRYKKHCRRNADVPFYRAAFMKSWDGADADDGAAAAARNIATKVRAGTVSDIIIVAVDDAFPAPLVKKSRPNHYVERTEDAYDKIEAAMRAYKLLGCSAFLRFSVFPALPRGQDEPVHMRQYRRATLQIVYFYDEKVFSCCDPPRVCVRSVCADCSPDSPTSNCCWSLVTHNDFHAFMVAPNFARCVSLAQDERLAALEECPAARAWFAETHDAAARKDLKKFLCFERDSHTRKARTRTEIEENFPFDVET